MVAMMKERRIALSCFESHRKLHVAFAARQRPIWQK
jgi:hypothetical protein